MKYKGRRSVSGHGPEAYAVRFNRHRVEAGPHVGESHGQPLRPCVHPAKQAGKKVLPTHRRRGDSGSDDNGDKERHGNGWSWLRDQNRAVLP